MQVVGIDFGTSNVRISTWDPDADARPQPIAIGTTEPFAMPAVVALELQEDNQVKVIVGIEADGLVSEPDLRLVIPNLKRLALSTDEHVDWYLREYNSRWQDDEERAWPPSWLAQESLSVKAFGQEFPVWDLIGRLLSRALELAEISGDYEWSAGCPVHSDFRYRSSFARALSDITGKPGGVDKILDEPALVMLAATKMGTLPAGSYLVFDVGGGSFDSSVVELSSDGRINIWGSSGHPRLGGTNIDDHLARSTNYVGPENLLRDAKSLLINTDDSVNFGPGMTATGEDMAKAMDPLLQMTASVARDAYIEAKTLWKRHHDGDNPTDRDNPPVGQVLLKKPDPIYKQAEGTGREPGQPGAIAYFAWQLGWSELAGDFEGIILYGGPTYHPKFTSFLESLLPQTRVMSFQEILEGQQYAHITGVSIGACFSRDPELGMQPIDFTPYYVNRLPARIHLEDMLTGKAVEYEPFRQFCKPGKLFDQFISDDGLEVGLETPPGGDRYILTVTSIDGVVLEQIPADGAIAKREMQSSVNLVIDRFGCVAVKQQTMNGWLRPSVLIDHPPWQSEEQRKHLEDFLRQQKAYEEHDRERKLRAYTGSPFLTNE